MFKFHSCVTCYKCICILTKDTTAAKSNIFTSKSSNCSKISSHIGLPSFKTQNKKLHFNSQGSAILLKCQCLSIIKPTQAYNIFKKLTLFRGHFCIKKENIDNLIFRTLMPLRSTQETKRQILRSNAISDGSRCCRCRPPPFVYSALLHNISQNFVAGLQRSF